jgi:hypothetical protein
LMEDHVHRFGAFGVARFTGNPRRECLEPGCRVVSLDNYEDEALPALAQIDGWVKWFEGYGARRFLESFLRNAHGAQSQCRYCSSAIYLDLLEGCGVADWRTVRGIMGVLRRLRVMMRGLVDICRLGLWSGMTILRRFVHE